MDAAVKQTWVEALRSGKYTQGTERLRNEDGSMCCLGVLWDVTHPGEWRHGSAEQWWARCELPDGGSVEFNTSFGDEGESWFGLSEADQETLIMMNDGGAPFEDKKSFQEIADFIETEL